MNSKTISKLLAALRQSSDNINILDVGKYNENAHTSFLATILRHRNEFIRSFLAEMLDEPEDVLPKEANYLVETQVTIKNKKRPDLVIASESIYAVVENKVCCAGDGGDQIRDYWNHVQEMCKDPKRRPCLIYLTLAGGSPAEWSIGKDELKTIKLKDYYHERSYKYNIIEWLEKNVIGNCLNSERALIASIELYIEYLRRKAGFFAEKELANQLIDILVKNEKVLASDMYDYVVKQQREPFCISERKSGDDFNQAEQLFAAFEIIRQSLINDNIFLDEAETAYNLKWVLKNNPTLRYKNMGYFDTDAFSSVGQFTYYGEKYVECATSMGKHKVCIHVPCSRDGLKRGPYVLKDIVDYYGPTVRERLEQAGFIRDDNGSFRVGEWHSPNDLIELAHNVELMIHKVESVIPEVCT